jgi:hypothetical protein
VFFQKDCIVLTYVDDYIILGKTMADVDAVISSLHVGHKKFQLVDQGSIDKYLGLMICDIDSNTFEMSQKFINCWILELLSLDEHKTKGRNTPVGKPLLHCDLDGVPRKHPWLYCGAVGMLSYLGNSIRPEIQMAVHQTARFSVNPMRLHKLAIMCIRLYLCNNCECGIIYKVDKLRGLEVYIDADFAGGLNFADADNANNVLLWTGFVICYANCPLIWCSNLQTKIALSTAEAEYIAMSHALQDTIPVQKFVKEVSCIFFYQILLQTFALRFIKTTFLLYRWQNYWNSILAQNILQSSIITFAAEFRHPSTKWVISSSSTFQLSSNLLIFSQSQSMMIASSSFAICYVDGDIDSSSFPRECENKAPMQWFLNL